MKKVIIIFVAFLSVTVMAKNCLIEDYGNRVEAQYEAYGCGYTITATKNNNEFQLIENCYDNDKNSFYTIKRINNNIYKSQLNTWDKYGVLIVDKTHFPISYSPGEAWHERITKHCK